VFPYLGREASTPFETHAVVLDRAGQPMPPELGTLDAIHNRLENLPFT